LPSIGVRWFRKGGGMPPLTLAPVSGRYLSFAEREEIAVLLAGGSGVREIARRLGRAPSTVFRELQRNAAIGRGRVEYRASTAQRGVNGHRVLPNGGHEFPHWWPRISPPTD
jgi:hypothetical protein